MRSIQARAGVAVCGMPRGGGDTGVQSRARDGCNQWEREPGIDDDDWDPPGTARIAPHVSDAPPAPRARSRGTDGWWTEPERATPPAPPPAAADSFTTMLMSRDPFRGYFLQDDD